MFNLNANLQPSPNPNQPCFGYDSRKTIHFVIVISVTTNLDSVHLLAGIAPPHIRRTVACRMERTRQTTDARHQLFHHQPAASRLKARKSFMRTVTPLNSSASSSRLQLWQDSLTDLPASVNMGLEVAESLPAGSG